MISKGLAKNINIFCLLAAIVVVLLVPLKKEIWYDETVSMLCSKGISHDTPSPMVNASSVSSATIEQLNTAGNVFTATVLDNGNSFIYNMLLHWFTLLFGNGLWIYVLFSKLCGISLLIAFYFLCSEVLGQSIITSIALLLLATDNNTVGMASEIRAYSLAAASITIAAVYFYKFTFGNGKPIYLFLLGLFSVLAVLSHFLSVYIVVVFITALFFYKGSALFSVKNIVAVTPSIVILGAFFYCAFTGLQVMSRQNHAIAAAAHGFSGWEVVLGAMKYTAINFKAVFPSFVNKTPVVLLSFLLIMALYTVAIKMTTGATRRNLHLLFLLGISSSIFLSVLCFMSHHYTALYFRYFSFCNPFCCLFIALLISAFFNKASVNKYIAGGVSALLLLPAIALFSVSVLRREPPVKYNHAAIAKEMIRDQVRKIEVPEWRDALLIESMLPAGFQVEYVKNAASPYFTLYKGGVEEKVLVIRNNS